MEYYHLSYEARSGPDPPATRAGGSSAVELHPLCPALRHAEQQQHNNVQHTLSQNLLNWSTFA